MFLKSLTLLMGDNGQHFWGDVALTTTWRDVKLVVSKFSTLAHSLRPEQVGF